MLIASTGLSINYHYCKDELADWSFMERALECTHHKTEKAESCCPQTYEYQNLDNIRFDKSDCCKTNKAKASIESFFKLNSGNLNFHSPPLLILAVFIETVLDKEKINHNIDYQNIPPDIVQQNFLFIQSFLL